MTEDSFYDGRRYLETGQALEHARVLVEEGADILDIGAESSRPGARPVEAQVECERVEAVLDAIGLKNGLNVAISIDTSKSLVARKALEYDIDMINDIHALGRDPELADLVSQAGCRIVLMHMQGNPETMQQNPRYTDVIDELLQFFENRIQYAMSRGIREENIILDPGIGFGKTLEHNLAIIRNCRRFRSMGFPVLFGPSRKSFIGTITGKPVEERLFGTAGVIAYLTAEGADILRVHDVSAMKDVIHCVNRIVTVDDTRGES